MTRRSRMQRTVWMGSILGIELNGVLVWLGTMGLAPSPVRRHWVARRMA